MGRGPGSLPLISRTEPPEYLIVEDLRTPHPYKQETRGLETIQATSFFPWWLLFCFKKNVEATGDLYKKKTHEIRKLLQNQACNKDELHLFNSFIISTVTIHCIPPNQTVYVT